MIIEKKLLRPHICLNFEENHESIKLVDQITDEQAQNEICLTTINSQLKFNPKESYFFPYENYSHSFYSTLIHHDDLLNASFKMATMSQLLNKSHTLPEKFFIRPNDTLKAFPGQIANKYGIHLIVKTYKVPLDVIAIYAPFEKIDFTEYRIWVINKEISVHSVYPIDWGRALNPKLPAKIEKFARKIINQLKKKMHTYVLDIATVNGRPKVIELNSVSTSAIYLQVNILKLHRDLIANRDNHKKMLQQKDCEE